MEDLSKTGQGVTKFSLEVFHTSTRHPAGSLFIIEQVLVRSKSPAWASVASGESIGHKRIILLDANASQNIQTIKLTVAGESAVAIRDFAAFASDGCSLPPAPPPATGCSLINEFEYQGVSLSSSKAKIATTVDECCAACHEMPASCVAFVFTTSTNSDKCHLLKTLGGGMAKPKVVSGTPKK